MCHSSVGGDRGQGNEKAVSEVLEDKEPLSGCSVQVRRIFAEPQVRVQSGTVPGTSRNMKVENQEPTEYRSLNDPHPEVGASIYWSSRSMDSSPEEKSYKNDADVHIEKFSHKRRSTLLEKNSNKFFGPLKNKLL